VKLGRIACAALAALLLIASVGNSDAAPASLVEAKALGLLNAAVTYLNEKPTYAFDADIVYDDVQPSGVKYAVRAAAQFAVRRPGEFVVHYRGDRREASFYSDGKTFAFYDQSSQVYSTAPATNDIDGTLDRIFSAYDFTVPLADFVSNRPGSALSGKVLTGYDLGPTKVGTTPTRHLLFTQDDIDWQIWIDEGTTPLVRAFAITYKQLPGQPEYFATFSDWKFTPVDRSAFTFTPPNGAVAVKFSPISKNVGLR
jgi:hypothetical protein